MKLRPPAQCRPPIRRWLLGGLILATAVATAATAQDVAPEARAADPAAIDPAAIDPAGIDPAATDPAATDPAPPRSAESALLAADGALHGAALGRDRAATAEWLAPDVVFYTDVAHRGRDAALAAWGPLWTGKYDFAYRGTPGRAVVAESGELGVVLGDAVTRFQHPAEVAPSESRGHYLNVWVRQDPQGPWRLRASSPLVVHAEWGQARDPRSGLMTAWPELADSLDAAIDIAWTPSQVLRAASGELAVTLGEYRAGFEADGVRRAGGGSFVAVWRRDAGGPWQLLGEGLTPPRLETVSESAPAP